MEFPNFFHIVTIIKANKYCYYMYNNYKENNKIGLRQTKYAIVFYLA